MPITPGHRHMAGASPRPPSTGCIPRGPRGWAQSPRAARHWAHFPRAARRWAHSPWAAKHGAHPPRAPSTGYTPHRRQTLGALPSGRKTPGALLSGHQARGTRLPSCEALGAPPITPYPLVDSKAQGGTPHGQHGTGHFLTQRHGTGHSPPPPATLAHGLGPPHKPSLNLALLSCPPAGAHSDKEAPSDTPRVPLPSSIVSIPRLSGTRGKTLTVSSSATAPGPPLRTTWSLHAPATVAPPSDPPLPFKLATSFSPIPSKLVHKVQALEFVEMRELLPDDIALGE